MAVKLHTLEKQVVISVNVFFNITQLSRTSNILDHNISCKLRKIKPGVSEFSIIGSNYENITEREICEAMLNR